MHTLTSVATAATALCMLCPATGLAAGPVTFDRNGNGLPDVRFVPDMDSDQSGMVIQFDNDEDGTFEFGFLSGGAVHNDGEIYAMWIDRNENGSVQKNELKMLPHTLPWATFPSTYVVTDNKHPDGSISHFMDYADDAVVDQVDRDADGDGDVETITLRAVGEGAADVLALRDANNDGYFDRLLFRPEIGDEVVVGFTKALQRRLPVMHYPQ